MWDSAIGPSVMTNLRYDTKCKKEAAFSEIGWPDFADVSDSPNMAE